MDAGQQVIPVNLRLPYLGTNPLPCGHERRRHKRLDVRLPGKLSHAGEGHDCDVLDISASGAQVSCMEELRPGAAACLRIGHLPPMQCRVVWQEVDKIGLKFTATPRVVAERIHGLLPHDDCEPHHGD